VLSAEEIPWRVANFLLTLLMASVGCGVASASAGIAAVTARYQSERAEREVARGSWLVASSREWEMDNDH
jgi:hypothetical protein